MAIIVQFYDQSDNLIIAFDKVKGLVFNRSSPAEILSWLGADAVDKYAVKMTGADETYTVEAVWLGLSTLGTLLGKIREIAGSGARDLVKIKIVDSDTSAVIDEKTGVVVDSNVSVQPARDAADVRVVFKVSR